MSADEPDWLLWAREIQATAQSGLAFSRDPYDIERYHALTALAARMVAARTDGAASALATLFAAERGYATPKLDVRSAAFDGEGRILMVREAVDQDRWTLPGGWADVNQTPAQCVAREVLEESGLIVTAVRYHSSQPWPFPSNLMLGLIADVAQGEAVADQTELEAVRWLTREEARALLEGALEATLPPARTAIAHHLIRYWAYGGE